MRSLRQLKCKPSCLCHVQLPRHLRLLVCVSLLFLLVLSSAFGLCFHCINLKQSPCQLEQHLKVQEQQQEGAIVAGAAARGLKLSGSPLYQLNAQKEAGATAIGSAETQFSLGDRAQSEQTLAGFNAGVLNMSNQDLAIQTDLSNQWLSSFTNLINTASSFLGKFWNPAQTMQSTGNNWNTNSAYDQSGAGYTPYMSEY